MSHSLFDDDEKPPPYGATVADHPHHPYLQAQIQNAVARELAKQAATAQQQPKVSKYFHLRRTFIIVITLLQTLGCFAIVGLIGYYYSQMRESLDESQDENISWMIKILVPVLLLSSLFTITGLCGAIWKHLLCTQIHLGYCIGTNIVSILTAVGNYSAASGSAPKNLGQLVFATLLTLLVWNYAQDLKQLEARKKAQKEAQDEAAKYLLA